MVLSDAESEYLNALQNEWINWQGDALADMGHDDALDAAFGVWHLGKEWIAHGVDYRERDYTTNPLYQQDTTDYSQIAGFVRK